MDFKYQEADVTAMKEWEKIFSENDEVYIYGAAKTAKTFLKLARDTNVINKIGGLVVTDVAENPKEVEGVKVKDIHLLENKNAMILVPHAGIYKREISELLKKLGFNNVCFVQNIFYYIMRLSGKKQNIDDECMDIVKERIYQIEKNKTNEDKCKEKQLKKDIEKIRSEGKPDFGQNIFYQSFEKIGLEGTRPSLYRIIKYGLEEFLEKDQEVLDIGCNTGFLDMMLAEQVGNITGIEYDKSLCKIADYVKNYLRLQNCTFINQEFDKWYVENDKKYDVIFSFAVHHWLNLSAEEYVERVDLLLKAGGYVCFESHIADADIEYEKCLECWDRKGYEVRKQGEIKDDGILPRRFCVLHKEL